MTSKAKKQTLGCKRTSTQRWPAPSNLELEAYLLSRDTIRRIQRKSAQFAEARGNTGAPRLH